MDKTVIVDRKTRKKIFEVQGLHISEGDFHNQKLINAQFSFPSEYSAVLRVLPILLICFAFACFEDGIHLGSARTVDITFLGSLFVFWGVVARYPRSTELCFVIASSVLVCLLPIEWIGEKLVPMTSDFRFRRWFLYAIHLVAVTTMFWLVRKYIKPFLEPFSVTNSNFDGAELVSSLWQDTKIVDSTFIAARLINADLGGTIIENCLFGYADLDRVRFYKAEVIGSQFDSADLHESSFGIAKINNCSFVNANLAKAEFNLCKVSGSTFAGANLKDANLADADLVECIFVGAISNSGTNWPRGFVPSDHGVVVESKNELSILKQSIAK